MKEIVLLGRTVRWTPEGIEFEADGKHRKKLLDWFGFDSNTKTVSSAGEKEPRRDEGDEEALDKKETI